MKDLYASAPPRFKKYPAYKDSGVEWLGKVPLPWMAKRLRFSIAFNPPKSELKTLPLDQEVSFVPMEAVGEYGRLNLERSKTIAELINGFTYFRNGDVLVAKITPCFENGKGAIAEVLTNGIGFGTTELHVLRPNANIDGRFLFFVTISHAFRRIGEADMYGAGGQKRVPEDFIRNMRFPIPSIDEQRSIASFLDHKTSKIDALIAKKRLMIELLQEKRTTVISQAVTKGLDPDAPIKDSGVEWLGKVPKHWEVKKIKRLCLVKRGASPRPIDDPKYFDDEGEYAWVRIADVTASERYLETTTQKLSELGKSLSVPLQPGELFLSIAGSVGKPIITKIKCCIHDGFVYFFGLKQNQEFLYYIFASGQPYLGLGKMGTQLNLNTDTVGDIKIGLPDSHEQQKIVHFLDRETNKIDNLIKKVQEAIDKLLEYRTALISAAVMGKIDVRGGAA